MDYGYWLAGCKNWLVAGWLNISDNGLVVCVCIYIYIV